ncbi:hypothetical protein ABPG72_022715 [Tetrahymena utriculariae]
MADTGQLLFKIIMLEIYQQHEKNQQSQANSLANKQEPQNEIPQQQTTQQGISRSEFKQNGQGQSLLHPSKTKPENKSSDTCC